MKKLFSLIALAAFTMAAAIGCGDKAPEVKGGIKDANYGGTTPPEDKSKAKAK